jgi:hypothetical protein
MLKSSRGAAAFAFTKTIQTVGILVRERDWRQSKQGDGV